MYYCRFNDWSQPSLQRNDRHTVTLTLGQLPLGACQTAIGSAKPVKALNFLWGQ